MKRFKTELSLLLVAALVLSSVALGFGQLSAGAADAAGTGMFRAIIAVRPNGVNCNDYTCGTDSAFRLQFIDAAGNVVGATLDNAIEGRPEYSTYGDPMENGQTTTYGSTPGAGGNIQFIAPSTGEIRVSRSISRVQLVNTYWEEDWYFDNVYFQYSADGGTTWVDITSGGEWKAGASGAIATWNVSWFGANYKTLTFNANGGTGGGTYDAIPGQTITEPVPTRPGYAFTGWSPAVPARMPNANPVYTAQWTPTYRNITFDANGGTGGTGPTSMLVGSALTPPTVERPGYTFVNWLPAVPATVPGVDTTYTAQWRETNPAVTFESNGGSAVEAVTPGYNNAASKPADPAKAGLTFGGWYREPALTTPVVWPFTVTQSTTFYAKWNAENSYTIIFDANGGTGGTSTAMPAGDPLEAPAVARTGYTFAGWSPAVPETVPADNTIYTAQWTANTYTVSYAGNGNDAGVTANSLHTYNVASNLTVNGFTKVGNTLLGWSPDSGAETAAFTNGQSVLNLTPNRDEVITFYAVWSINYYNIIFNASGGSGGTTTSMQYGAALTAPTVTKTGYTFTGWSPAVPATVPAGNTTYTTQWTANQYLITFDPQGGSVSPTSSIVTYGSTYGAGTGGWPEPTRTGYVFVGWYSAQNGSGFYRSSTTTVSIEHDQTLYAKWIAITYTVAYNGNGSTGGSTIDSSQTYGTASELRANGFTKTGYAFAGWAKSAGGDVVYSDKQSVLNLTETNGATVTLYAKWTNINVATINFNANGGTGGTSTTLIIGANLTAPAVTKEGYTLIGWSPAVPATVPAADTTYTAQWAISVTITFDANGGTGSTSTVKVEGAALTAPTVSRTGYTFAGWSPAVPATVPAVNTTYTAQWAANQYLVTFDLQGGSGLPTTLTVTYGSVYGGFPTPTRTGYTLNGWYTDTNGWGSNKSSTSTVSTASNHTLYAYWRGITYTVAYNGNGSTGGSTANSAHTYGTANTLTANGFTKTGYAFVGWATSAGGDVVYPDKQSVLNLTETSGTTITLYAKWTDVNVAAITFDANGGTGGTSKTLIIGETLTAPTVYRTPYTFTGWSPGVPPTVPAESTTYTAQWTARTFTVTFNPQDGTVSPTISTVTYGSTYGAGTGGLPMPTKAGYIFGGWYTSTGGAGTNISSTTTVTITSSQTLYAYWTAVQYFITFDANGGTGGTSNSMTSGTNLTAPAVTKEGYELIGWSPSLPATVPAADTTYTAQWAISVTITFNANGGTGGTSKTLIIGETLTAPTVTRAGHSFTGWSPAVPPVVPDVNTTYTAHWTANQYLVTFDPQGGSVSPTSSTVTYGSTYGAGTGGFPTPVRTGYTFGGWYTSTGGAGTNILSTTTVTITASQTLYAKWTGIPYTVAYNGNGSTGGSTASATHTYGTSKTLTANGFTKTGFAFIGWATSPDGAVVYSNKQSVLNLTETSGATVTLYAKWTDVNVVTIIFDANGGTGGTSTLMIPGEPLTAPAVTRTGYTFTNWSPAVPSTVPIFNNTYTALWTARTFTVTFNPQSGTVSPTTSTVTYDSTYGAGTGGFPTPVRTGYTFGGWFTSSNGGGTRIFSSTIAARTSSQTLYAYWTADVTIAFDANGGTGGTGPTAMTPGAVLSAPTVTRTGYTFTGWSPAVPSTVPATNTTYTAQWSQTPSLVPPAESTAVIDNDRQAIYGLAEGLSQADFESSFVSITGNGRLEITITPNGFGTGTKVELIDNATNEVTDTWYIVIFGDVNGDGLAGTIDADLIYNYENYLVEWDPETEAYLFEAGDLNGDGLTGTVDADIIYNCENYIMWIDQTTGTAIEY